jgi:hypothetical protein
MPGAGLVLNRHDGISVDRRRPAFWTVCILSPLWLLQALVPRDSPSMLRGAKQALLAGGHKWGVISSLRASTRGGLVAALGLVVVLVAGAIMRLLFLMA